MRPFAIAQGERSSLDYGGVPLTSEGSALKGGCQNVAELTIKYMGRFKSGSAK